MTRLFISVYLHILILFIHLNKHPMKRLIMPALLVLGLLLAGTGYSQTAVKIDKQFSIQLTNQMIEQGSVELDFSGLNFKDEESAQKFFKSIENNLMSYTVDFSSKTATMFIYADRLGNHTWSIEQWNSYMSSTSQSCITNYQSFSNQ